ncbi:MAG TPA: hypothetical protein VG056_14665 [Pirellulales bacterium]|nr:hypothetical protein [Pirellulales bacterium]
MSQPELLKRAVQALDDGGIEYMLTGSIVSSIQGAPRSTHDIDIVIDLSSTQAPSLVAAFPSPDYHVSDVAVAMKHQQMFKVLEVASGQKVDFWIFKDDPFNQSRFARRRWAEYAGKRVRVSSPEDTILAKLNWAQMSGGSEKQFTDALRVYELQGSKLDLTYLNEWADRLQVRPLWERLQNEAAPVD